MSEEALYTDPYDQSLWFYHQCLLSSLYPPNSTLQIAPDLSMEERRQYLSQEIRRLLEMLQEADDCKWIYQSLVDLASNYRKAFHTWPENAGTSSMSSWLERLMILDSLRAGRWQDLETELRAEH